MKTQAKVPNAKKAPSKHAAKGPPAASLPSNKGRKKTTGKAKISRRLFNMLRNWLDRTASMADVDNQDIKQQLIQVGARQHHVAANKMSALFQELQAEKDACVKFCSELKVWIYCHRNREIIKS